jgi:hypothetical protein
MRIAVTIIIASIVLSRSLVAQELSNRPLNVIDWIDQQPSSQTPIPLYSEPDVADSGSVPEVSVGALNTNTPRRIGLAPSSVTGLPDTLWSSSDGLLLTKQIKAIPNLQLPALQSLYYTLLIAEASPPSIGAETFDLIRVDELMTLGALDSAMTLMEQIGPTTSTAHFKRYFDMALLAGTDTTACTILVDKPQLSPSKSHEIYCKARIGKWEDAVLLLGTGKALGLVPVTMANALERFLDPDLFESEPALSMPTKPDPLSFRLYQAIGTPIPARVWPLIYANADLADTAGWKAQVEAAERLARVGSMAENRLLGLYTLGEPAASGGVWDRIEAIQRFEVAINSGSSASVATTLPDAWEAMQRAQLAVQFANLFSSSLSQMILSGRTADIAFQVLSLSELYETAARLFPTRAIQNPVMAAIAKGNPPKSLKAIGVKRAILDGFRDAQPDQKILEIAASGALGSALLDTVNMMDSGGKGDLAQLTTGLATLRALGLEDVARRTALQILLLEVQ